MQAIMVIVQYWKQIAVVLFAAVLIAAGYYVRSLAAERDQLSQENAVLAVQLQGAAATQELANRMTEAIGQIKIRSNVNVSRIESVPPPHFVDSRPLPFIAGGVHAFSLHSSAVAGGAGAGDASGGALSSAEPSGRVLPY
jgi:hypothetical protein